MGRSTNLSSTLKVEVNKYKVDTRECGQQTKSRFFDIFCQLKGKEVDTMVERVNKQKVDTSMVRLESIS